MAWEATEGPVSLVASTGIIRHRFTTFAGGKVSYPSNGGLAEFVCVANGTTGSTEDGQFCSVQSLQNAATLIVSAKGSTLAAGDLVSASSRGQIIAATSDKWVLGRIVAGSSGSTGRQLTIVPLVIPPTSEW